ncbi:MAG: carboxymuconolactone decarboxylase family protein [Paracoccaceae bacterium]
MLYAAVSISNSCDYCTHSHLAAARAEGMTEAEFADFLRVVSSAGKTNHLLNGLRIPVDAAFLNEEE